MAPKRCTKKKGNKKKIKARDRCQAAQNCAGCAIPLQDFDDDATILCLCTTVRYCTTECQQEHPHQTCPGPPEARIDLDKRMKEFDLKRVKGAPSIAQSQLQENQITVQQPIMALMTAMGWSGRASKFTVHDYAQLADEGKSPGHLASAYLAGCRYKHRLLGTTGRAGRRGKMVTDNSQVGHNLSVLESRELAHHYFHRAAILGHGLAMQSLGDCYDEGIGVRENRRLGNDWLWRAVLHNSQGALQMLDARALIPLEVRTTSHMLDQVRHRIQPGQSFAPGGPNMGSLLVLLLQATYERTGALSFSLPPFAGPVPTTTVGNQSRSNLAAEFSNNSTPMVATMELQELFAKIQGLSQHIGATVIPGYGRRGTMKAATVQTHGNEARLLDSPLFLVPPAPECNETPTMEETEQFVSQSSMLGYDQIPVYCVHSERHPELNKGGLFSCNECISGAVERLAAVSTGGVALSTEEAIPHRGLSAIYRGFDDELKQETWKSYSIGEIHCVLAVLAVGEAKVYANPLFIAQDPNLFWPVIATHGTIRAALEFVAPHIDWTDRLGMVKESLEQTPVIDSSSRSMGAGKFLRKCGNDFCANLKTDKGCDYIFCKVCHRRQYCSRQCAIDDYPIHKHECKAASTGAILEPTLPVPENQHMPDTTAGKQEVPAIGEDIVIHGLLAKPQYNGAVGTVLSDLNKDGRHQVRLRTPSSNTITIKPANFYNIGLLERIRKKDRRTIFECSAHKQEVCPKCYFDFTVINRLVKLQASGQEIDLLIIDRANEVHFASIKRGAKGESNQLDEGWPIECHGMKEHPVRRFIMKALLDVKGEISSAAAAARAGMVTYGGRRHSILQAYATPQVEKAAKFHALVFVD